MSDELRRCIFAHLDLLAPCIKCDRPTRVGVQPCTECYYEATTDPAASATADSSPANPPASDDDPAGSPPPEPAGFTNSERLVKLIAAVLVDYTPTSRDEYGWIRCLGAGFTAETWRRAAAYAIAERIEKSTPAVDLTYDELTSAASIVRGYPLLLPGGVSTETAERLGALADRLTTAATP